MISPARERISRIPRGSEGYAASPRSTNTSPGARPCFVCSGDAAGSTIITPLNPSRCSSRIVASSIVRVSVMSAGSGAIVCSRVSPAGVRTESVMGSPPDPRAASSSSCALDTRRPLISAISAPGSISPSPSTPSRSRKISGSRGVRKVVDRAGSTPRSNSPSGPGSSAARYAIGSAAPSRSTTTLVASRPRAIAASVAMSRYDRTRAPLIDTIRSPGASP